MNECLRCHRNARQRNSDRNASGSQRYQCQECGCRYTPDPSVMYDDALRAQAVEYDTDGMSFRKVAGHLGVDPVTGMMQLASDPIAVAMLVNDIRTLMEPLAAENALTLVADVNLPQNYTP